MNKHLYGVDVMANVDLDDTTIAAYIERARKSNPDRAIESICLHFDNDDIVDIKTTYSFIGFERIRSIQT